MKAMQSSFVGGSDVMMTRYQLDRAERPFGFVFTELEG